MEHLGTVNLKSEDIYLRRFNINDAEETFKNWANDENVTKFLTWEPHENVEESREIIKGWLDSYKNKDFYQWAICLSSGELIGSISVVDIDDSEKSIYIGYCIGKKYWRHGYTSKSLKMLIRFFFDEVGIETIYAKHDVDNVNSGRVMKSAGMKYFKTENSHRKDGTVSTEDYYKISFKNYVNSSYSFD